MNGLLKTLIKPDWDDSPKRSEIIQVANLIQIGEFQLIQLAYKAWYKQDLPENKINNILLRESHAWLEITIKLENIHNNNITLSFQIFF